MNPTLWNKGFKPNQAIHQFTIGNDNELDMHLIIYDCLATKAHIEMLGKIKILTSEEVKQVTFELDELIQLVQTGKFEITKEEDCHTAIENFLTKKLGDIGKNVHTGRSRNDQVLTALRLYYQDELKAVKNLCLEFIAALENFKKQHGSIEFPGYTHMRKAMPSSIDLWTSAFVDSMEDNLQLLKAVETLINQCPLGTGAGYGIPLNLDREFTAKKLGFQKIQSNPIYAQMSRGKFESSLVHVLSQIMFDLNKLSNDSILFSMPEFSYFELPKNICTGSSIMPQKQNPDVLELLRAKYHLVTGFEFQIKNITGNLISGYNRDIQLTKELVINSFQVTKECLQVVAIFISNLKVDKKRCQIAMTKELFATEETYSLMQKYDMPFREAYQKTAKKFL